MTQAAFDYWVEILKRHFPAHPALSRLGTTFCPRLLEEAEAMQDAHARAHPVFELKDQDGARRADPDMQTASEWLEIMKAGDALMFARRDGGSLHLRRLDASTLSARCLDPAGAVLGEAHGIAETTARQVIQRYLDGNAVGCARELRSANACLLTRLWRHVIDPA